MKKSTLYASESNSDDLGNTAGQPGARDQDLDSRRWSGKQASTSSPKAQAIITIEQASRQYEDVTKMLYSKPQQVVRLMTWEFAAVITLVLADIFITAYLDPLISDSVVLQILVASLQVAMPLAITMAIFVLTSQTVMVKLGRYDRYLKTFWLVYVAFLLEFLLILASKAYYLVVTQLQYLPHLELWEDSTFFILWNVQRAVLCIFWVTVIYTAFLAFDPRWYNPDTLLLNMN